jgi:hypothetical protein
MQAMPFHELDRVIAREQEVFDRPLDDATVETQDGRRFTLACPGLDVRARWDQGLELQVGQRTLRRRNYTDPPPAIPEPERRARLLSDALRAPHTVGRLVPGRSPGTATLYGLVDPRSFRPTDKVAVRTAFLDALGRAGIPTASPRFGQQRYAPAEQYALPSQLLPGGGGTGRADRGRSGNGPTTRADIRLRYGLDTGCSGYWLTLSDVTVVVCTNGLVFDHRRERAHLLWRHVQGEPIEEFLGRAVPFVIESYGRLEQSIETARTEPADLPAVGIARAALPRSMDPERLDSILSLVAARERLEARQLGHTTWAASQALSWVGSHEVRGLDGWRLRGAAIRALGAA